jgi:hypothetical protein
LGSRQTSKEGKNKGEEKAYSFIHEYLFMLKAAQTPLETD